MPAGIECSHFSSSDPYAGDATALSRRDVLDEELSVREEYSVPAFNETKASYDHEEEDDIHHRLSKRATLSTIKSCTGFTSTSFSLVRMAWSDRSLFVPVPIAAFSSLSIPAYYDLASPASLDGGIRGYANMPPYYSSQT